MLQENIFKNVSAFKNNEFLFKKNQPIYIFPSVDDSGFVMKKMEIIIKMSAGKFYILCRAYHRYLAALQAIV